MSAITTEESTVAVKTRELCQTIVDLPEFQGIRSRIEAFLADDAARGLYDTLNVKGQMLQQKQQMGMPLSDDEISDFEKHRDQLLANSVVVAFLDAQKEMGAIQDSIYKRVSKTFELGRMPTEDDLSDGSCCGNSGCGCH
ncbi:MAG: YlbF family regulator [Verrucomicrobiota bacterium]